MQQTAQRPDLERTEFRSRVLHSLLTPVVRLARRFGISMKGLLRAVEMAYYHELKQDQLTMREIGEQLDLSMRKVALLSRALKTNFFQPELAHDLPRRIEFMLWAAPLSEARICQVLPAVAPAEIAQALAELLEQGRIVEAPGRTVTYRLASGKSRLRRQSWVQRIGGLNSLMGNVGEAVYARFFAGEPSAAFARTVALHVRREDLPNLERLYEELIFETLSRMDDAARDQSDTVGINFSVLWSPDHANINDEEM